MSVKLVKIVMMSFFCDRPGCNGQEHFASGWAKDTCEDILKKRGWAILPDNYALCAQCMKQTDKPAQVSV